LKKGCAFVGSPFLQDGKAIFLLEAAKTQQETERG